MFNWIKIIIIICYNIVLIESQLIQSRKFNYGYNWKNITITILFTYDSTHDFKFISMKHSKL